MKQVMLRMMHPRGAIECLQRVERIPKAGQLFPIDGLSEPLPISSVVVRRGVTTLVFQPSTPVYETLKTSDQGWAMPQH